MNLYTLRGNGGPLRFAKGGACPPEGILPFEKTHAQPLAGLPPGRGS